MKRYKIKDVMTDDVVAVQLDASYADVLRAMGERKVAAVPVIDERRKVVGIITESDLLLKAEHQELARPGSPQEASRTRHERAKAEAATARGLMSSPAVAVTPEVPVAQAARLLTTNSIDQVPVTEADGRLVGIATRSDMLRVFLRPDQEIRDEVQHEVLSHALWGSSGEVEVRVHDGVVGLYGRVQAKSLIPVAVRLALSVEGVVDVMTELAYERDDTPPPLEPD